MDQFFEMMSMLLARRNDPSERVAPVAELFAHVAAARDLYGALMESGRMHDVKELGEAHFARGIEARLAGQRRVGAWPEETRAALAHALAGALLALLTCWVRQGMTATPERMDRLFHAMVLTEALVRT